MVDPTWHVWISGPCHVRPRPFMVAPRRLSVLLSRLSDIDVSRDVQRILHPLGVIPFLLVSGKIANRPYEVAAMPAEFTHVPDRGPLLGSFPSIDATTASVRGAGADCPLAMTANPPHLDTQMDARKTSHPEQLRAGHNP
ncbi:MAG: hypothetical protein AB7O80_14215 [Acetobacteraceae bacterium]